MFLDLNVGIDKFLETEAALPRMSYDSKEDDVPTDVESEEK